MLSCRQEAQLDTTRPGLVALELSGTENVGPNKCLERDIQSLWKRRIRPRSQMATFRRNVAECEPWSASHEFPGSHHDRQLQDFSALPESSEVDVSPGANLGRLVLIIWTYTSAAGNCGPKADKVQTANAWLTSGTSAVSCGLKVVYPYPGSWALDTGYLLGCSETTTSYQGPSRSVVLSHGQA